MRTNISVPISMTPDLADWLTFASRFHGSRSAFVRRLLEREQDSELSQRIESLEKKVKELEKTK